jgi:voltage-gated potassium channel
MRKTREKIYTVIFGTNTPAGKGFDVVLLVMILLSVMVVLLESVKTLQAEHHDFFASAEWFFTFIFTLEYLFRIFSHPKPIKYVTSFMGIIDLLAILPTYLGIFFDSATFLLTVRAFRLLRMFRILKLTRYVIEGTQLLNAMKGSLYKITIFFGVVLTMVLLMGTLMYMIEGEYSGFTSIPQSIYWAIVTITTVGYGDIAPATVLGKMIASLMMLTGYSIIAVPTGIISVEIGRATMRGRKDEAQRKCNHCGHIVIDDKAKFCSRCGGKLDQEELPEEMF